MADVVIRTRKMMSISDDDVDEIAHECHRDVHHSNGLRGNEWTQWIQNSVRECLATTNNSVKIVDIEGEAKEKCAE